MVDNPKPKFRPYETWGACSRCNARVPYSTLVRERRTGILVCGPASGRPVRYCLDPWPEVYDFQVSPDKSIEPPPEPLPLRYNLDDIWGNGNHPKAAPDDATRLQALVKSVPSYTATGVSASFSVPNKPVAMQIADVTKIVPAEYDGTFLPSNSVRTVTPPDAAEQLYEAPRTDLDEPADKLWTPPWGVTKGV